MQHEFDACVVKECGTRKIFFRGLLLADDPRSSLFLIEVQRALTILFGPTRFTVLRYACGLEARGRWVQERGKGNVVHYHHSNLGNIYYVQNQDSLVACMYVSPVDLTESIVFTLLDGHAQILSATGLPDFPQGFPDQAQHPGTI